MSKLFKFDLRKNRMSQKNPATVTGLLRAIVMRG